MLEYLTYRFYTGFRVAARSRDQRMLLQLLAIACEHRLPYAGVVRAFAQDRPRSRRLQKLALELEQGVPLADAVEKVPGILTDPAVLAIRCGTEGGTLRETLLSESHRQDPPTAQAVQTIIDAAVYSMMMLLISSVIVLFLVVKIMPAHQAILDDFSATAPPAMRALIGLAEYLSALWPLALLLVGCLGFSIVSGRLRRALRSGWIGRWLYPQHNPDTPQVMRQLAITQRSGRPLSGTLSTLARYHARAATRGKLLLARNEIEQGMDVWQGLQNARLATPQEATALRASEIVGNTPWILEQVAEARDRRYAMRLNGLKPWVFPVVVLLFASLVVLVAQAAFVPMLNLVWSLV